MWTAASTPTMCNHFGHCSNVPAGAPITGGQASIFFAAWKGNVPGGTGAQWTTLQHIVRMVTGLDVRVFAWQMLVSTEAKNCTPA